MDHRGRLDVNAFWARELTLAQRIRDALAETPVYTVADWSAGVSVGQWSWSGSRVGVAEILHLNTTSHAVALAARTVLDRDARARPGRREGRVSIPVDEEQVECAVFALPRADLVLATVQLDKTCLELVSERRIWPDVRLQRIQDIEPFLAGRSAALRSVRGE